VRIHRGENKDGLARDGNAEVLDQHQPDHRQVAELVEDRFEGVEYARQVRRHGRSDHG
jgi:hypothetical protein